MFKFRSLILSFVVIHCVMLINIYCDEKMIGMQMAISMITLISGYWLGVMDGAEKTERKS